jgi:hypothetical protein
MVVRWGPEGEGDDRGERINIEIYSLENATDQGFTLWHRVWKSNAQLGLAEEWKHYTSSLKNSAIN